MTEYKKITKDDVYFPAFCFFFIKKIKERLDEEGLLDSSTTLEIRINTTEHPYCYEAFELVVRTFERQGYYTRIPSFHREKREGLPDEFQYKWIIRKRKVYMDDLPF